MLFAFCIFLFCEMKLCKSYHVTYDHPNHFVTAANNQAACESKTNAQHTYVWGVPFDPYDTIGTIQEECLVQPKPIECAQAPWSR